MLFISLGRPLGGKKRALNRGYNSKKAGWGPYSHITHIFLSMRRTFLLDVSSKKYLESHNFILGTVSSVNKVKKKINNDFLFVCPTISLFLLLQISEETVETNLRSFSLQLLRALITVTVVEREKKILPAWTTFQNSGSLFAAYFSDYYIVTEPKLLMICFRWLN